MCGNSTYYVVDIFLDDAMGRVKGYLTKYLRAFAGDLGITTGSPHLFSICGTKSTWKYRNPPDLRKINDFSKSNLENIEYR